MQKSQKNQFDKLALDLFNSSKTSKLVHVLPKLSANLEWIKHHKEKDSHWNFHKSDSIIERLEELKILGANLQHVALRSAYLNYPEVTQYLIDNKVNFDIFNKLNSRLVYMPIKNNVKKVVDVIIKNNAIDFHYKDPLYNDEQVMHQLLRYGHINAVNHILATDPSLLYSTDKYGKSFLYFCFIGLENSRTRTQKINIDNFIKSRISSDLLFIYQHKEEVPQKLSSTYKNLIISKYYEMMSDRIKEKTDTSNHIKTKKI